MQTPIVTKETTQKANVHKPTELEFAFLSKLFYGYKRAQQSYTNILSALFSWLGTNSITQPLGESKKLFPIEHEAMGANVSVARFIQGIGAKMFTIAGPVIVYGVSASVVYGIIYWITTLF